MPAALAPALLHLALGAGLALSHELGVRGEASTRARRPLDGQLESTFAGELQPSAWLRGAGPTLEIGLGYAPILTRRMGDGTDLGSVLHQATAEARWRPGRTWRLRADGRLARGTSDLLRLATEAAGPGLPSAGGAAPIFRTLPYERYELGLGAEAALAPRLRLAGSALGSREGGLGAAALEFLPLQHGVRAAGELAWQAARTTTLAWGLAGDLVRYADVATPDPASPGGTVRQSWSVWSARLEGAWRHAPSREARLWAGAGAAVAGGDGPGQPRARLRPSGEVGAAYEPPPVRGSGEHVRLPSAGVSATVAPAGDRLTGALGTQAGLRAWLAWAPGRWSVGATLAGWRTLDGPLDRDTNAAGELHAGWGLTDRLRLSVGGRATAQWTPRVQARPATEWVAFLAVEASHRGRW